MTTNLPRNSSCTSRTKLASRWPTAQAADDARHAARRKLGNPTRVRENAYEANSLAPVEALAKDLRYAARLLRRSPGFAVAAILSLALGIGANTAIFQLLDALRLRSLPIPRPHELMEVVVDGGNRGYGVSDSSNANLTNPLWEGLRDSQQAFAGLFVWGNAGLPVGRGRDLQFPRSIWVSGDFFQCVGTRAPPRTAAGSSTIRAGARPVASSSATRTGSARLAAATRRLARRW